MVVPAMSPTPYILGFITFFFRISTRLIASLLFSSLLFSSLLVSSRLFSCTDSCSLLTLPRFHNGNKLFATSFHQKLLHEVLSNGLSIPSCARFHGCSVLPHRFLISLEALIRVIAQELNSRFTFPDRAFQRTVELLSPGRIYRSSQSQSFTDFGARLLILSLRPITSPPPSLLHVTAESPHLRLQRPVPLPSPRNPEHAPEIN
eukprot:766930-Hanusia_phi.AAC.3